MRILTTKEVDKPKIPNKRAPKKVLTKRKKIIRGSIAIVAVIFGVFFVSGWLGSIFNPLVDEGMTGWSQLDIQYITADGEFKTYKGDWKIDLYFAENGTIYEKGLTDEDFPYFTEAPTNFLIRGLEGDFEYQYRTLVGNPDESEPYINLIILKRAVDTGLINVETSLVNITYLDYQDPDPLNQILTEYELSSGETTGGEWFDGLPFGDLNTYLTINITGIPLGYTLGPSTIIPPDIFEENEYINPIAYLNGFNKKGLFLAFDAEIEISSLIYSAEGNFFLDDHVYEVALSDDPDPDKLWVVDVQDIDINDALIYRFKTDYKDLLNNIYFWSGWLDEYQSYLIYNQYNEMEA